eukprot:scpid80888/ scgid6003/ Ubiquitin-like modifier-activating enzyme 1 Y; Ubiquitin-activating enzyme E1; Ubiquitin-activating enzyme E1 Y
MYVDCGDLSGCSSVTCSQPVHCSLVMVSTQVVKASTGKFSPLRQWCHMEFYECIAGQELSYEEVQPTGSRYDDMVAVFGKTFQEELAQLKYFMVGCGALGCEFLKNFAMMGVACGQDGSITVTDDDIIERSNLTRQFLFRNRDVGRSKSAVAARAVKAMNPDISLVVHQVRTSPFLSNVVGTTHAGHDTHPEGVFSLLTPLATTLDSPE